MDRALRLAAALTMAIAALLIGSARAQSPGGVTFQTWHPWQLDSVLVAWTLAQSQLPAPLFESVPRGMPIAPERAIDTPESPYRRTGQRTAFEEALRRSRLQHGCAERLREAVRVVELASWRKPEFPQVEEFEARVLKVIPAQPARGGLEAAFAEVERYCREAK